MNLLRFSLPPCYLSFSLGTFNTQHTQHSQQVVSSTCAPFCLAVAAGLLSSGQAVFGTVRVRDGHLSLLIANGVGQGHSTLFIFTVMAWQLVVFIGPAQFTMLIQIHSQHRSCTQSQGHKYFIYPCPH